jgi:RHS repeat-associated protein
MTTVRYTTINGEVIAEKRNGSRRLYVPDPLGSTVALLDNTQTQVDTFAYWPYGEVRASTGTTPPPFQFVGTEGYYTDGAGRTYVRARYLHTQKGRWLTQDPVGFDGGEWNLYRYSANSPTVITDPEGLQVALCPCGCGGARGSCCHLKQPPLCAYRCTGGKLITHPNPPIPRPPILGIPNPVPPSSQPPTYYCSYTYPGCTLAPNQPSSCLKWRTYIGPGMNKPSPCSPVTVLL